MTRSKMLVFDMDGTIADLYGVKNWCDMVNNNIVTPYEIAKPLYDMEELNSILEILKLQGYVIAVTSWLAKKGTEEYNLKVRQAKIEWLKSYNFPFDELHIVKYGTTKANCTRNKADFQILIDDNEKVRSGWSLGTTINAEENIIPYLWELVE